MIKVENLTKVFGAKSAVDGISFTVGKEGKCWGSWGRMEPGQSTSMRMIIGLYPPTAWHRSQRKVLI